MPNFPVAPRNTWSALRENDCCNVVLPKTGRAHGTEDTLRTRQTRAEAEVWARIAVYLLLLYHNAWNLCSRIRLHDVRHCTNTAQQIPSFSRGTKPLAAPAVPLATNGDGDGVPGVLPLGTAAGSPAKNLPVCWSMLLLRADVFVELSLVCKIKAVFEKYWSSYAAHWETWSRERRCLAPPVG